MERNVDEQRWTRHSNESLSICVSCHSRKHSFTQSDEIYQWKEFRDFSYISSKWLLCGDNSGKWSSKNYYYPNKFCCPNSFVFPFSYSIVFLVCLVQLKAIKFFSADVIKNIFRLNATVSEVWHTKWLIHHAEIFDS